MLTQARGPVDGLMDVKTEKSFALRDRMGADIVGIEYVGALRRDPTVVLLMSLALTRAAA